MIYRLSSDAIYVEKDNEIVLLHMESGVYFNLRGAILQVFESLVEGSNLEAMASKSSSYFAISKERATGDLQGILDRLLAAKLVTRSA
jgi:hypothetical protein